jgi:hypothetical protein
MVLGDMVPRTNLDFFKLSFLVLSTCSQLSANSTFEIILGHLLKQRLIFMTDPESLLFMSNAFVVQFDRPLNVLLNCERVV